MAEGKESFLLYRDIIHTVRKMPSELRGDLFLMILEYVNDEDPQTDNFLLEIAFEPIKQTLKRDLKRYQRVVLRNQKNGKKGGRPPINKGVKPKKPSGLNGNPKNPTEPKKPDMELDSDIDSVNDIDTVSDIVTPKRGSKRFYPPSPQEVDAYFLEKGLTFSQAKIESEKYMNHYEAVGWMVGKNKMKDWKASIRNWISRRPEFEKEKGSGQKEKGYENPMDKYRREHGIESN